jgi:hypothetical protein
MLFIQTLLIKREIAIKELVPIWYKSLADVFPIKIHLCTKYPNKMGVINECLSKYRVHNNNVSKNNYKMFYLNMDTIINYCPKQLQQQAIVKILPLLGDCYKLFRKEHRANRLKKFLNLLNPIALIKKLFIKN